MDAVASEQHYFYASSHLTFHPVASTNVLTGSTELGACDVNASTFCPQEKGFIDPEHPPEQLMLADPSVFFNEGSAAERALKRFNREAARTRYLAKRRKRVAAEAAKGLRPGRQKKHESRARIAHNRPRMHGRFIKKEDFVSCKELQKGDLHQAYDKESLTSSEEVAVGATAELDSDARQQEQEQEQEQQEQQQQQQQQQQRQQGQPRWTQRSLQHPAQQFGQDGRMSIW
eukprot:COSAG02_NODE_60_length_43475_cov_59.494582_14_plen_230_part_00